MNIIEDIDKLLESLLRQKAFVQNYPELQKLNSAFASGDKLYFRDAAKIGEIFGREGWVRTQGYSFSEKYNWEQTIDGVGIVIMEAEEIPRPAAGSPVLPKQFPLLLNETNS
jgi:hypothetical protein